MSGLNAFISNGTCYKGRGDSADDLMLPCGNAGLGHKTCCQAGDMCLSSHACFNGKFGVTYLAGCSDPDYEDGSCPDKGAFDDQAWAGLVYCNGTSNQWIACEQSGDAETLTDADSCFCPSTSRTVAFTDGSILDNVVQLPTSSGGSVIWQPGYVPSPTSGDGQETTTGPGDTGTAPPTPNPTDPGNDPDVGSGGLSTGAKAGIGVGVSVGALLILAALALLFLKRRRRASDDIPKAELDGSPDAFGAVSLAPGTPGSASAPSELDSRAARPWSVRSELDATASSSPGTAAALKRKSQLRHGDNADMLEVPKPPFITHDGNRPSPVAELPG